MKIRFYIFSCVFMMAFATYAQDYEEEITDNDETLLPEGLQMYELDSLLNDWMTKNYLTNVENCLSTGVNPEFDHETYALRLSRLPNVIEMPYNEIAEVLETSEGALKASYHHAYEKIKAWMKAEMDVND